MKRRKDEYILLLKNAVFVGYLAILSYGLFFAESMGRTEIREVASYNLRPFTEIRRYISQVDTIGLPMVALNLLGNIIAFVPFGYLLPSMWMRGEKHHPLAVIIITMFFSIVVELLQFVTRSGICDIDDVILNTVGGLVGYLVYIALEALAHRRRK